MLLLFSVFVRWLGIFRVRTLNERKRVIVGDHPASIEKSRAYRRRLSPERNSALFNLAHKWNRQIPYDECV